MQLSKAKTTLYSSLSQRKMRKRHSLFIVEGEKCVADTIGKFKLEALVATAAWVEKYPDIVAKVSEQLAVGRKTDLDKISSLSTSPEVVAIFHMPAQGGVPPLDLHSLNLLLDGIQDPGNLGTIVRTAHWFGFHRIYASTDTADIFNPKAMMASMGSAGEVDVVYCDLHKLLIEAAPLPVYGTLLNGRNIFKTELKQQGVIIMGNEGKGISQILREKVTHPLLIPPYSETWHGDSLNVAAATAITLALFRNQKN